MRSTIRYSTALITLIAGCATALWAQEPGGRFYERLREVESKLNSGKFPLDSQGNPVRPSTRRRTFVAATTRKYSGFKPAAVTFSTDERSEEATSPKNTGDIILLAEPEDIRVYFNLKGGAQLLETTTATIKQCPPNKKLHVVAWAPDVRGKSDLFVPVKANHITTVRLVFPDNRKPAAKGPVEGEKPKVVKPAGEGEKPSGEGEKPAGEKPAGEKPAGK